MQYLVQFYDEWNDFRHSEFISLLELYGSPIPEFVPCQSTHFIVVEFDNEEIIHKVCSRAVLIKAIYHLWSSGFGLEETAQKVSQLPIAFTEEYTSSSDLWSVQIESYCKSLSMSQKESSRQKFRFLDFKGKVSINNAVSEYYVVFDFSTINIKDTANLFASVPTYFGKLIARAGMRDEINKYDLKKRLYLGPTSLDTTLAFILANMSKADSHSFIYDPFVGTGSILIALTHYGASCTGSDIDIRVLKGEMHAGDRPQEGMKRDIFENFKSYGLPAPELVRMDNHLFDRHCVFGFSAMQDGKAEACKGEQVQEGWYTAIVTDPPYGIRAGAKKTGRNKEVTYAVSEEMRADHIPCTQQYAVEEVMLDLLHTAARSLVCGGLLTYILPTTYDFTVEDLPVHPCLQLQHMCHQPLSTRHGRRIIVMRKHRSYTVEAQQVFAQYKRDVMSGEGGAGFGQLKKKLENAFAADAFENEGVVKQTSGRFQKRKDSKDRRRKQREEGIFFDKKQNKDSL